MSLWLLNSWPVEQDYSRVQGALTPDLRAKGRKQIHVLAVENSRSLGTQWHLKQLAFQITESRLAVSMKPGIGATERQKQQKRHDPRSLI